MFAMFTRDVRPLLTVISGAVVAAMALTASGTASAAALIHAPGGVSAASAGLSRPTALAAGLQISYATIDPPGADTTVVTGITRTGWLGRSTKVVGWYDDTRGRHGFVMSGGRFTILDVSGAEETQASGINGRGEIVGHYVLPGIGGQCSFTYTAGKYTTIPGSCSASNAALMFFGINNSRDIVGDYAGAADNGFVIVNGIVKTGFAFPGDTSSDLFGINNNPVPETVGAYSDSRGIRHGMAFTGTNASHRRSVDMPGAGGTTASGVNDSGQIVGAYVGNAASSSWHGFVDTAGRFRRVDYPGASFTFVYGIDDRSSRDGSYDMVGNYRLGADHGFHGFIATVTPIIAPSAPIVAPATPRR